jgi:hypothetical protein
MSSGSDRAPRTTGMMCASQAMRRAAAAVITPPVVSRSPIPIPIPVPIPMPLLVPVPVPVPVVVPLLVLVLVLVLVPVVLVVRSSLQRIVTARCGRCRVGNVAVSRPKLR